MTPLLTPNTAILYSYLDISLFSASESPQSSVAEVDVFSQAFDKHRTEVARSKKSPSTGSGKSESSRSDEEIDKEFADALSIESLGRCAFEDMGLSNDYAGDRSENPPPIFKIPSLSTSVFEGSSDGAEEELQNRFYTQLSPDSAARIERNRWGPGNTSLCMDNFDGKLHDGLQDAQVDGQNGSPMKEVPTSSLARYSKESRKRKTVTEEEQQLKHKKFLERNRLAAGKCRERKKQRVGNLEERYDVTKHINLGMKERVLELEAEIRSLKSMLDNGHLGECTMVVDPATSTLNAEVAYDEEVANIDEDILLVVEEQDLEKQVGEVLVRDEAAMAARPSETRPSYQFKRPKQAEVD